MFPLNMVGVCVNDEPGDREALRFAALIGDAMSAARLHCIHIRGIETDHIPPSPRPEEVRRFVGEFLPPDLCDRLDVHVCEQTGVAEVIRMATDLNLELLVMGRRLPHDQLSAGSELYRLVQQAGCSVLFTPSQAHAHLSRLLVWADRTENSRFAVRTAVELARATGDRHPQVLVHAVYSLGYGQHYTGRTRSQAARDVERLTREELTSFLMEIELSGVQLEIVCTCSDDPAAALIDLAAARNMDAVVVGTSDATLPASVLMGGTVKTIVSASPVPVLVAKRKGQKIYFLDALLATA